MAESRQAVWDAILMEAIEACANDIYLTAGQAVWLRVDGSLCRLSRAEWQPDDAFMELLAGDLLSDRQREALACGEAIDFSLTHAGRRLRGNLYRQQAHLAMVLRLLPSSIPTLAAIHAPQALQGLLEARQGLVLVTGRTGSGKTTTMASFLQAVNESRAAHILTLEDPVEYVFTPSRCFVSQRELGRDFRSFPEALRSALREMPDILLVGEIRDRETMTTALAAAETGMLVLGTLHTRGAAEAVRRIEGFYPQEQQSIVRAQVADVFCAIFAQELLPARKGGRVPCTEVLLREPSVASLIRQGKYSQIEMAMMTHQAQGMQTRAQALQKILQQGLIAREVYERAERRMV